MKTKTHEAVTNCVVAAKQLVEESDDQKAVAGVDWNGRLVKVADSTNDLLSLNISRDKQA